MEGPEDEARWRVLVARADGSFRRGQGRARELEACRAACLAFTAQWTRDFVFSGDGFTLEVDEAQDCLVGAMRFADSMLDEWFAVFLLRELTRAFAPFLQAAVTDNDGQFLLIEGAYLLPEWISPENSADRVLLAGGHVHLVRPEQVPGGQPDLLERCAAFVREHGSACRVTAALEDLMWRQYVVRMPNPAIKENRQRLSCLLPRSTAAVLRRWPSLAPLAAGAACDAQRVRLAAAGRMRRCRLAAGFERMQVTLSRCAYAKLMQLKMPVPPAFEAVPEVAQFLTAEMPTGDKAVSMGMKLACGLELLLDEAAKVDAPRAPAPWKSLSECTEAHPVVARAVALGHSAPPTPPPAGRDLVAQADKILAAVPGPAVSGVGGATNEACVSAAAAANADDADDDDSWLYISPGQLEEILERSQASENGVDLEEVQAIADSMKRFLEGESGIDGVEFRRDGDESESSDESSDEARQEVTLDVEKVIQALGGDTTGHDGEEASIREVQEAMDDEIAKETSLGRGTSGSATEQQQQQGQPQPLKMDLNLVENMLEAYAEQSGLPGPASNLLREFGLQK